MEHYYSIWVFIVILTLLLGSSENHWCVATEGSVQENKTAFIPTNEWQQILPDQPVPPGLRVRLNLQTGQKEAKLMGPDDMEEDEEDFQTALSLPTIENDQESVRIDHPSHTILEDLLQQESLSDLNNQSNDSAIKSRFRSYEELKAEFEAMNMQIQTDDEIIAGIVRELEQQNSSLDESRLLMLLEDLDYLLHQVDNGKKFAEDGGFALLAQILQSRNMTVKRAALQTFSAAIQGNTVAKVIALQNGTLDTLYDSLKRATVLQVPTVDSLKVIQSGLGTLGALLRDFPAAQRYFFSNHSAPTFDEHLSRLSGFVLLADLFDFTQLADQTDLSMSVRMRILTFLTDLARERTSAKQRAQTPDDSIGQKMWELYSSVPFESGFVASGWCTRLQDMFRTNLNFVHDRDTINHGHLENLLTCILHLDPVCDDALLKQLDDRDPQGLRADLLRLHEEYSAAVAQRSARSDKAVDDDVDDGVDFFAHDMQRLIEQLLDVNGTRRAQQSPSVHDAGEL